MALTKEQLDKLADAKAKFPPTVYLAPGEYEVEVLRFWQGKNGNHLGCNAKVLKADPTVGVPPTRVGEEVSISIEIEGKFGESGRRVFRSLMCAVYGGDAATPEEYKEALANTLSEANPAKGQKIYVKAFQKPGKNFTHYVFRSL
jgi:hypothetical protein